LFFAYTRRENYFGVITLIRFLCRYTSHHTDTERERERERERDHTDRKREKDMRERKRDGGKGD